MATNFFFNNFQNTGEQRLIEDLVIETIKIYGQDMYYLLREGGSYDSVLNENPTSEFKKAYLCEFYIKNVEGFGGQGDFLSKFNIEIRDQVTLTVARRVFENEVGSYEALPRPREGDLIYFPLNKKIFEIKFVEHEAIFYQMGSLQTYDLKCELYEYGSEYFNTGIADVDAIYANYSASTTLNALQTEDGYVLKQENGYPLLLESISIDDTDPFADNDAIQTQSDDFIDFSERDPFSEGGSF